MQSKEQRERMRRYRENVAGKTYQRRFEGLSPLAFEDVTNHSQIVLGWLGDFILCNVVGQAVQSRDPSHLFGLVRLDELHSTETQWFAVQDAHDRLGEYARLVLLGGGCRCGGVVSDVRSGGGRRAVGGVLAKRGT